MPYKTVYSADLTTFGLHIIQAFMSGKYDFNRLYFASIIKLVDIPDLANIYMGGFMKKNTRTSAPVLIGICSFPSWGRDHS